MTDTERLDYLQRLTTGRVILRMSDRMRGWRLHETTTHEGATENVRDAIDKFISEEEFLFEG